MENGKMEKKADVKVITIYEKLLEAVEKLPKEAIEVAKKEITRKGYDTTGYQYQFLVNVLNEVLGLGNWGFKYEVLKETSGVWSNGKSFHEITADITVWIKLENSETVSFSCVGGHKSEMHSDALKGAITNGFKKTVAFFGVGKKAYEGTIDDDYRPLPEQPKAETKKPVQQKPEPEQKKEIELSMAAAEFLANFESVGELKALQNYAGSIKSQIAKLPAKEKKYLQDQYILIAKKYNGGKV